MRNTGGYAKSQLSEMQNSQSAHNPESSAHDVEVSPQIRNESRNVLAHLFSHPFQECFVRIVTMNILSMGRENCVFKEKIQIILQITNEQFYSHLLRTDVNIKLYYLWVGKIVLFSKNLFYIVFFQKMAYAG